MFDLRINRLLPAEFGVAFHLMFLKILNIEMVVLMQQKAFS